jgi:hypothetical protein
VTDSVRAKGAWYSPREKIQLIGRVLDMRLSSRTAALAYWQGQYVAIDQNEDAIRLAEVSLPAARVPRKI